MTVDTAVVPVAGHGTRLLPLTKSQPHEMLPIGREPVVQYVVEELMRAGVRRQRFVTGPGKIAIENHFDENAELVERLRVGGKEELLQEFEFDRHCAGVRRILVRAVASFYERRARDQGIAEPRVGCVAFTQRFDSALRLNGSSPTSASSRRSSPASSCRPAPRPSHLLAHRPSRLCPSHEPSASTVAGAPRRITYAASRIPKRCRRVTGCRSHRRRRS